MFDLSKTIKNTNQSLFDNLHQIEIDIPNEGKKKFWYVGSESGFQDLVKETFSMESYKSAMDKKDMVIIDAGAFVGDTAYAFHPYAKVIYALEPNESAYAAMLKNIEEHKLDKVMPINKGLWSSSGKQRLYATDNSLTGACAIAFSPGKVGFDMETMTIDQLFDEFKLDHVDLLKLDIEGSEYAILESESFKKVADKIDRIILEAHPYFVPGNIGGSIWQIPYHLEKYGFVTKTAPGQGGWNVRVTYSDGSTRWVPMRIFIAERQK